MRLKDHQDLPPVPFAVSGAVDPYPARKIVRLVEDVGVRRAALDPASLAILGAMAGLYVAVATVLASAVATLGPGPLTTLLESAALASGVALALVAAGEIFAANLLVTMAWADGLISGRRLRRHWAWVFGGNLLGAMVATWAAVEAGLYGTAATAEAARAAAEARVDTSTLQSVLRAGLGSLMLGAAVWVCFASHGVTDRVIAVMLAVTLMLATGCDHALFAMAEVPAGMMLGAEGIELREFVGHLAALAIGNMLGGGACVALVYLALYGRRAPGPPPGGGDDNGTGTGTGTGNG